MKTIVPSLAVVVLLGVSVAAQWTNVPRSSMPRTADGKPNLSAPAPRLPDGKPDLSGVWNPPLGYVRDLAKDSKEPVPFQPWAKTEYDVRASGAKWREEPDANCLPQGVPKVLWAPAPWRIVQTPAIVFFVHEAFNLWWQAFMDGRQYNGSPDNAPTWHGYSTAKWDGDTLVVRTSGFRDDLWLDAFGHPLGNSGTLTERIRRPNFGTLQVEMTIEDTKFYTAPWTVTITQPLVLDSELIDYYCLENEKDWAHMKNAK